MTTEKTGYLYIGVESTREVNINQLPTYTEPERLQVVLNTEPLYTGSPRNRKERRQAQRNEKRSKR